jgi:hypothetical protein
LLLLGVLEAAPVAAAVLEALEQAQKIYLFIQITRLQ